MNLTEKYLLTDAKDKDEEKGPKKDGGKVCFHCKTKPALPKRSVCQGCGSELEAWRNKKDKKTSDK